MEGWGLEGDGTRPEHGTLISRVESEECGVGYGGINCGYELGMGSENFSGQAIGTGWAPKIFGTGHRDGMGSENFRNRP